MAKIKGTALIGAVKRLRREKDRARDLLPAEFHHYLQERIMPASWYPEEVFLEILKANIKLMGLPVEKACTRLGKIAAQEHHKMWYGKRLSPMDSRTLLFRLPSIWSSQHDTGRYEFIVESATSGRIEIRNFKYPSQELCLINTAYALEFLQLSGFGKVTVSETACTIRQDEMCAWNVSWTKECA